MSFFETRGLTKYFGGLCAVNNLSVKVEKGEILGLIGPNGSGKTTVFNLINGYFPISGGDIFLEGKQIGGLKTNKICKLGVGRTFQVVKPLQRMTTLENVMCSAFNQTNARSHAEDIAMQTLEFCELVGKKDYPAKGLTIGDRKRLEIARALATGPKLLLLDETMAGLTPQEQALGVELIKKVAESGVTIIIVEHIMKVIMSLCSRIVCINYGQSIAEGTPETVANHPDVIEAYLGKE
ncbi:MAG: ABC transporter ATP-binding protein [Desulfovibrio sp.]|mgnify:CR=1 FL=1|nr:MAG: ABC transporter ATP-binding protein [Desulfovibrio sp.]